MNGVSDTVDGDWVGVAHGASTPDPRIGRVLGGRYRVDRLIAKGGMATVYLAHHLGLHRPVALKVHARAAEEDREGAYERRFRLEAETLATLDHPNIVTIHDYGRGEDGCWFLVMEYIDGPRLTDLLQRGTIDPARAVRLALQVCAALRYAHRHGLVHRDLKPSNLLIRRDAEGREQVKVVDFGLVKVLDYDQGLTREGLVLGSPHCMAPEQVRGHPVDFRADIYAVGVLLFRTLTGGYPFHGPTSTATMIAHVNEPIPGLKERAPRLEAPARLDAVVRRCLAKNPAERYPDVLALIEDLELCRAACDGPPAHTRRATDRIWSGGAVPIRALVLAILAAGAVLGWYVFDPTLWLSRVSWP